MPFDLAQLIRLKGMIDAVVERSPEDPLTATPALVDTYLAVRNECLELVEGSDVASEFQRLFPEIKPVSVQSTVGLSGVRAAVEGDRARLLLAQLAGWLGSWPSAEQLLSELITALEKAVAEAEEPTVKNQLRGTLLTCTSGAYPGAYLSLSTPAIYRGVRFLPGPNQPS